MPTQLIKILKSDLLPPAISISVYSSHEREVEVPPTHRDGRFEMGQFIGVPEGEQYVASRSFNTRLPTPCACFCAWTMRG